MLFTGAAPAPDNPKTKTPEGFLKTAMPYVFRHNLIHLNRGILLSEVSNCRRSLEKRAKRFTERTPLGPRPQVS